VWHRDTHSTTVTPMRDLKSDSKNRFHQYYFVPANEQTHVSAPHGDKY
jgi:hypothetical protein